GALPPAPQPSGAEGAQDEQARPTTSEPSNKESRMGECLYVMRRRNEELGAPNTSMPDGLLPAPLGEVMPLRFLDPCRARDVTQLAPLVRARRCFFLFFFFFLSAVGTAGGCMSHGATQNDASSSEGGGGSSADDASAPDAPAPDAGSGDGGLWPCAPPADPTQPHPTLA